MQARIGTKLMKTILATTIGTGIGTAAAGAAEPPASTGRKADANVIFADDFESWGAEGTRPLEGTWVVRQNKISRTRVVPGKVTVDGSPGAGHLRITFFSLETYYHGLPNNYDRAHPIRVYFDNLVIARQYIGP